ncbi:MAG: GNAT family N-acetyltransferase [Prevotellaceae bacterium]|jgi:diamine N-acetyltransferase|nr:GNAT family N-acetyltransferase [Prevotellaceae bacterium]
MQPNATLHLRAVEPLDIELLYEWENNRDLWGVSETLAPFSREAIASFIAESQRSDIYATRQLRLMVDVAQAHDPRDTVGIVDLYDFDPQNLRAGVGILIYHPAHRRKGIATQALRQLMSYAFSTLHLHQLYCGIAANNAASLALFRKLGFEQTGLRKAWRMREGGFEDEVFMQKILGIG